MTRTIRPFRDKDSIRLRFSVKGQKYSFFPVPGGRWEDADDRRRAEVIAAQIEGDLKTGNFDPSLKKYGGGLRETQQRLDQAQEEMKKLRARAARESLSHLWPLYRNFKARTLAASSIALDYDRRVGGILPRLPTLSLSRAPEIRDWILANTTPGQARRILTQINACCDWAKSSGLIEVNPFAGYAQQIHLPREEAEISPFTLEERDRIIQAFEGNRHQALVKFLFFVGCRPSEALALEWSDLRGRRLTFRRVWVLGKEGGRLKTQKKRVVLLSTTAAEILEGIENDSDLIFPSEKGKHIDWHNFTTRDWRSALEKCPDIEYRKPYQTRHSFITWRLAEGDSVQDVANYVGNSPTTIYKSYAGLTRGYCPD